MECRDDGSTKTNHDAAEYECAQNAPKQHAMLEFERYPERRKDHGHYGNVVQRKRFFNKIAGIVKQDGFFTAFGCAFVQSQPKNVVVISQINQTAECQRQADPECSPFERFSRMDFVNFSIEYAEVKRQQRKNEQKKDNPWYKRHLILLIKQFKLIMTPVCGIVVCRKHIYYHFYLMAYSINSRSILDVQMFSKAVILL